MPRLQAPSIMLSEKQEKILMQLRNGTHSQLHLKRRSEIILLAYEGKSNHFIAKKTGLARGTVIAWRNRFFSAKEELAKVETETPRKLRAAIEAALSDEQRAGAPATFTDEQVACIIALSCEEPAQLGLPFSHWTPTLLREECIRRGIVSSISAMQIGRFLKRKGFKTKPGEGMAEP